MSERITHASDGTPGIERDHPQEDAPTDDLCERCLERIGVEEIGGKLTCATCAEIIREDDDGDPRP